MRQANEVQNQMSYTKFPNELLDNAVRECSPHAFVMLTYIVRKTIGWNKKADGISYSQILRDTSINSRATIKKCAEELKKKGFIDVTKHKNFVYYRPIFTSSPNELTSSGNELTSSGNEPVPSSPNELGSSGNELESSPNEPVPVQEMNTQKKRKETNKKETNRKKGPQTKDVFERVWYYVLKGDAKGLMANEEERLVTAVKQYGWVRLCHSDPMKKNWTKKDFMEVYRNVTHS